MNRIVELTSGECRQLLYQEVVGRVGFQTPVGPRIVPVNYALHRDAIVWRTKPFSELATYAVGKEVVLEVDQVDRDTRTGWDVVAFGRVEVVTDRAELDAIRRIEDPAPWAEGRRSFYMKLRWRELRGRRIGEPRESPLVPSPDPWESGTVA